MNKRRVFTVEDVARWILKHRGEKVFKDWTAEQIMFAIDVGVTQNLFFISTSDVTGELTGVCLLRKIEPFKVHVSQMITLGRAAKLMPKFIEGFRQLWPATKYITFDRRGIRKQYSFTEFEKKVKAYG